MSSPTPTSASSASSGDRADPTPKSAASKRLPWQAVVSITVLATLAAVTVFFALGGSGSADEAIVGQDGATELTLTPQDQIDTGDALQIAFTRPDGSEGTVAEAAAAADGPIVVNFFASWCPPCIGEMPDFEAASQMLGDRVGFLGLAVQDRPEDAERIVEQTGVTYAWARDIRGDIAGAAGVVQMPTTMFLDADGNVVDIHAGAVDQERLLELVAQHLGVEA